MKQDRRRKFYLISIPSLSREPVREQNLIRRALFETVSSSRPIALNAAHLLGLPILSSHNSANQSAICDANSKQYFDHKKSEKIHGVHLSILGTLQSKTESLRMMSWTDPVSPIANPERPRCLKRATSIQPLPKRKSLTSTILIEPSSPSFSYDLNHDDSSSHSIDDSYHTIDVARRDPGSSNPWIADGSRGPCCNHEALMATIYPSDVAYTDTMMTPDMLDYSQIQLLNFTKSVANNAGSYDEVQFHALLYRGDLIWLLEVKDTDHITSKCHIGSHDTLRVKLSHQERACNRKLPRRAFSWSPVQTTISCRHSHTTTTRRERHSYGLFRLLKQSGEQYQNEMMTAEATR